MTETGKIINKTKRVAVIGARGFVGHALIKLLSTHPYTELVAVSSRSAVGKPVYMQIPECKNQSLVFLDLQAGDMENLNVDVIFLALPNNIAHDYINAIRCVNSDTLIIDLSFDHRIDSTNGNGNDWVYAIPEINKNAIKLAKNISNPGCYATAAQLALHPLRDMLATNPVIFGISGYSGAGSTPNDKNNPDNLRENVLPYALVGHLHEIEISKHIGHSVNFMPHVANFFSGLSVTITCDLATEIDTKSLIKLFTTSYQADPLIKIQKEIPCPQDIATKNGAIIGGFSIDPRNKKNIRMVAVIDNLLKGAAVQALQNMNLALGFESLTGIES